MKTVAKIVAFAAVVAVAAVTEATAQRPNYKREVPPRLLRQTKVSEDSALKVAQARIPSGTVKALELENEGGELIWSFDIAVPNRPGIYEVHVNARTGALSGRVEHEMPAARRDSADRAAMLAKARPILREMEAAIPSKADLLGREATP
jgi:hypothetical protein